MLKFTDFDRESDVFQEDNNRSENVLSIRNFDQLTSWTYIYVYVYFTIYKQFFNSGLGLQKRINDAS